MTFPSLPTPPNSSDPATFAARADAFFAAIPQWSQDLASYGNAVSLGFSATSNTSMAMPAGGAAVSMTVDAGKGFAPGMRVIVASSAAPSQAWFFATVVSYAASTGVLSLTVDFAVGAGTLDAWVVVLSQPYVSAVGADGSSITSISMPTIGSSVTLTASALRTWKVGDTLQVASTANPSTTRFVGTVTAYNSATGALTLACKWARGSGTVASWVISPSVNDTLLNMWTSIDSTASATLDLTSANHFKRTVNSSITFVFSNAPSGQVFGFTLVVTHTSGTITWPASVVWPEGAPPSLNTGKVHRFTFLTDDGGTTWAGSYLANYTG